MYNGTHGQWGTEGNDYRGHGVQEVFDTWSMGYRGMGHMGNGVQGMGHMGNEVQGYGAHGQWGTGVSDTWAMGYRGMRHMYGQWGTGVWGT